LDQTPTVGQWLTIERIWGKPNPSKSDDDAFEAQFTETKTVSTASRFPPEKPFKRVFD
jgi:hypothetical protein